MRRWCDEGLAACLDALRAIRGYPGTAAWSIGLFAFGTAFFLLAAMLVWRVIIHPKDAAPAAREMVVARAHDPERGLQLHNTFGWRYAYIARRQTTLACWVASRQDQTIVQDRDAERHVAFVRRVSSGLRQCWGLTLHAGREFRADDHEQSAERVAIVGERMWREVFDADPSLVGDTVEIGGETVRVVGISTSLGKPDLGAVDVWWPATDDEIEFGNPYVQVDAHGRPRQDVSYEAVDREFAQLDADYRAEHPDHIDAALQGTLHRHEGLGIYGIVAYSVTVRRGEHALRMALGASSTRVLAEIVTRQLRATWPGLVLGVVASLVATPVMAESVGLPMAFDLATGLVAMIVIVGAVVFAALLPALRVRSIDPWETLREE